MPAETTQVLLAGVDTLIMNVKRIETRCQGDEETEAQQTVPEHLREAVECWQEIANTTDEPFITAWEHHKTALHIHPHGTKTYQHLFKNGLIDLMLSPRLKNNAAARVRFSSEYLWKRGVDAALADTHAFLKALFKERVQLQPAEVHLCADVARLQLPKDYDRLFVYRAAKDRPIKAASLDNPVYRYHRLETLQFSGHGNAISATIYNKPAEIEQKSHEKKWFYDMWKQKGWNEDDPVYRVECRIERKGLHEMDIEDPYLMIEKVPAIWAYCVGHVDQKDGWMRMVKPNTRDTNRWRWNTANGWIAVQKAFSSGWRGYDNMEDVQRERKREVNLDRAEKAIAGYTATYAAWLQEQITPTDDASVVLQLLYDKMLEIWEHKGTDFQALRRKKQSDYHIS